MPSAHGAPRTKYKTTDLICVNVRVEPPAHEYLKARAEAFNLPLAAYTRRLLRIGLMVDEGMSEEETLKILER